MRISLSHLLSLGLLGACGGEALEREAAPSFAAIDHDPSLDLAADGSLDAYAAIFDDDPEVELRINDDARALTTSLLPELSAVYDLDSFELDDQTLVEDTAPSWVTALLACHNSDSEFEVNMLDVRVAARLDDDAVTARFAGDRQIETDLDLPHFDLDFTLQFKWPHLDSAYCNLAGTDYDIRVDVDVDGVAGSLDVTMSEDGAVEIASIDRFTFDVDGVSFGSSFLTSLTNLGLAAVDLFGGGCGATLTECVNNAIDDNLEDRAKIKNSIRDALNDALARVSSVNGAANLGSGKVDYDVTLTKVTTNDTKSRMVSRFAVELSSDEADAPCAAGLTRSRFTSPADVQTDSDLEIMVPYKTVTDLLYVVAKQGDLCAPFVHTVPRLGSSTIEIKPVGSFDIEPWFLNIVKLSVPVEIEAQNAANALASITATLEVYGAITFGCSGVQLTPTDVDIEDATGTLQVRLPLGGTISLSATSFINSYRATAEAAILAALGTGLTIAPGAYDLGDLDHSLVIRALEFGDSEVTLGADLVAGSACP